MARKQRSKGRQTHFKGPLLTVDETWKGLLRKEMERLGWDQKTLAEEIPASEGAISNMFKPGDRQVRFKKRIEELVGWTATDEAKQLIDNIGLRGTKLSIEQLKHVFGIVDSIANATETTPKK